MLERARARWTKVMRPLARALLRLGVRPDAVTWVGTIATVAIALICFPQGWLWQGVLAICLVVFSDSLDGIMARESGRASTWGAFLDSTLDRVADGAVFGALALYYAGPGQSLLWAGVAIGTLVFAQITSYAKARGEAVGIAVHVGLVGRADRLLIGLVATLLTGLGVTAALPVGLSLLFAGGIYTVAQRMALVRRVARKSDPEAP